MWREYRLAVDSEFIIFSSDSASCPPIAGNDGNHRTDSVGEASGRTEPERGALGVLPQAAGEGERLTLLARLPELGGRPAPPPRLTDRNHASVNHRFTVPWVSPFGWCLSPVVKPHPPQDHALQAPRRGFDKKGGDDVLLIDVWFEGSRGVPRDNSPPPPVEP